MKEKTKEFADEVGAVYPVLSMGRHDCVLFTETELETFVELVAAAEREACAKVCEAGINNAADWDNSYWDQCCENRAAAIRVRGNT